MLVPGYKNTDLLKVALWMIAGLLSTSMMAVSIREIGPSLSPFQILFVRSLLGTLIVASVIRASGHINLFFTKKLKLHLTRSVLHFCGQYGWIMGVTLLPLAEVFAIEFTAPIWTLIMAAVFLKEPLTREKLGSIFSALMGVWIIVDPGSDIIKPASLMMLGTALFFAATFVVTKVLAFTESPLTVLFYMSAVQCVLGFGFAIGNWVEPSVFQWSWMVMLALAGLGAHFSITKALQLAETSLVVTIDLLRLPLISLVGILFYGEYGSVTLFIGASLILAGNGINIYANWPKTSEPKKPTSL
jgi:drug/metabolite transporter (DMT)-like permease